MELNYIGVPMAVTRVEYPVVAIQGDVLVRTRHDEASGPRDDGLNSTIDETDSVPAFQASKYDLQESHPEAIDFERRGVMPTEDNDLGNRPYCSCSIP